MERYSIEQRVFNIDNILKISHKAHFHIDDFVNRQNSRFWSSENPHVIIEKQMHSQRVTVWCRFRAEGITGPYFFENEAGQAVTRYRDMWN